METLKRLETNWAQARSANHKGSPTLFKLRCTVAWGAATPVIAGSLPNDLETFWNATSGARLFVDENYGQWGLVLFGPPEAAAVTQRFRAKRSSEFREGDLIIGEFKGDSDLLLIRCDMTAEDFGYVFIPTPLDPRPDWEIAAQNLTRFLIILERAQGEKFWESLYFRDGLCAICQRKYQAHWNASKIQRS